MAIHSDLLTIFRCPVTGSPLIPVEAEWIERINRSVENQTLWDRGGEQVDVRLDAGLVNADRTLVYPVRDDIVTLLPDGGIPLDQLM